LAIFSGMSGAGISPSVTARATSTSWQCLS
jgi:hypothetical protein